VAVAADDADEVFWAIVHSHVRSPAEPSTTDVGLAFYPDALYIVVSLADEVADPGTGEPSLRAWRIVDGAVTEVALELV
jgi:proteasome lid subunit RPN8/RPN11